MIYPARYIKEPRKRAVYEDACDLIMVYGLPRTALNYKGRVSRTEMKQIWAFATCDAKGASRYDKAF